MIEVNEFYKYVGKHAEITCLTGKVVEIVDDNIVVMEFPQKENEQYRVSIKNLAGGKERKEDG